jgi:hypothetical protein
MMSELTQQRLKELLNYDPATGVFTWLVGGHGVKVGDVAGADNGSGYIRFSVDGKRGRKAHRLAWLYMTGEWPVGAVDHRDLDKANNAWANLREATNSQNQANKTGRNSTGFKGVYKDHNRFKAMISVNGKQIHLGNRSTPEEAHALYVAAANDIHGEFARSA